jgi:hypothetical protein
MLKIQVLAVLSATVFFYILFIFRPPVWLSVFVLFPLYFYLLYYGYHAFNLRARQNLKPLPGKGHSDRIQSLNEDVPRMQSLHFRKIGSFFTSGLPDRVTFAFKHEAEPFFCCLHLSEGKKTQEFISYFEGFELITGSDPALGAVPDPAKEALQIFPDADPGFLFEEHANAIRFLKRHGLTPRDVPESAFRTRYAALAGKAAGRIRSGFFWPLTLMRRSLAGQWRTAEAPLEDRQGLPFIKKELQSAVRESSKPSGHAQEAKATFRVVFRGSIREGFTVREAKENLSKRFGLDALKADTLFAGKPILIKAGVDEATALKFRDAFSRAGAECEILRESAAPEPVASSPQAGESASAGDPSVQRFQVRMLLASDRAALEREFKQSETVGWPGYALALSSFIPFIGVATGVGSIFYGLSRRRAGGVKIAMIGFVGLIFTSMGFLSSVYVKYRQDSGEIMQVRIRQAQTRLNDLVRAVEAFRRENGAYPATLEAVEAVYDSVSIQDPTDAHPVDGNPRAFTYAPAPSGETYFLFSQGHDGTPGTEDDVIPTLPKEEMEASGWRAYK